MAKDLRVIYNDNRPTGQYKEQRGTFVERSNQRGTFVERSNKYKGPTGRIQWKSRADTRLDVSLNNIKNVETYAYEC